jgi:hypothetical protein
MKYSRIPLVLALIVCALAGAHAQVTGKITAVTVYRGQALITREVPVTVKAGGQEIVIDALPENVVPESLFASGDDNLTIRAVRYRTEAVDNEPREEVRKLDDAIAEKQKALRRNAALNAVYVARAKYLDRLEAFSADTSETDINKGVLDPKALQATAEFLFTQRTELADKQLTLAEEKLELDKAISLLQRQRERLTSNTTRTLQEAVILLDAAKAGNTKLALSYLVNNVGWSPAYAARYDSKKDKLLLEYHAVITQMSGESWDGVKLTLSTTRPQMVSEAPSLAPMIVALVRGGTPTSVYSNNGGAVGGKPSSRAYAQAWRNTKDRVQTEDGDMNAPGEPAPNAGPQGAGGFNGQMALPQGNLLRDGYFTWNVNAARLQHLELAAPDEAVKEIRHVSSSSDELSISYDIPGQISLQSRSDQQMLRIAALELKSDFYYTAVPLLTEFVYQAVDAVNTSDYPLLPGPVNAYLNDAFAGRGTLPLVARGQSFTVGFGTETQLRANREMLDKNTETHGGNARVKYSYRIRIQNLMTKTAKVRVWDRIPRAPDDTVTVTMQDVKPALSTNEYFVADEKPRGLLRWDIDVPAQSTGAKAQNLSYQFTMEYDKTFTVGELPTATVEKMRADFDELKELQFSR